MRLSTSSAFIYQTHGMTLGGMEWDDPRLAEYAERVWLVNARCLEATAMMGAKCMVMHPANLPHDPLYLRAWPCAVG